MTPDDQYRKLQVWGLVIIALVIAAIAFIRARPGNIFSPGWYRF